MQIAFNQTGGPFEDVERNYELAAAAVCDDVEPVLDAEELLDDVERLAALADRQTLPCRVCVRPGSGSIRFLA